VFGLTRWSPSDELMTLHRDMDRLFDRVFGGRETGTGAEGLFTPAMDVYRSGDGWRAEVALPGIDPKEVQIDVAGSTLTVRGERKWGKEDGERHLSEIRYGRFERTITLPDAIDGDKVQASYRNGVLAIELPLKESAKPRRIEIATADRKALKGAA
jgi:HSP20 family protein